MISKKLQIIIKCANKKIDGVMMDIIMNIALIQHMTNLKQHKT